MRTLPWAMVALGALLSVVGAPLAAAQDSDRAEVGSGRSGLPAVVRVPVAGTMAPGLVLAGHAGYGFTEGVLGEGDTHHRGIGTLAVSLRPLGWLGVALRLDSHLDSHHGAQGSDSGGVGEGRLVVRASTDLSPRFALGLETVVFVPGKGALAIDFGATTIDALALLAWSPSSTLSFALSGGVRLDGTGRAVPERELMSRADRLALGASDSNAGLLGLGVSWRTASVELVAEVSADLLFGELAPPLLQSPLRAAAGARIPVARGLALSILAEGALSARPPLAPNDALVPVEPRISVLAGLVWQVVGAPAASPDDDEAQRENARQHANTGPPPPAAPTGRVTGFVHEEDGSPLAGATVSVEGAEPAVTTTTDATGAYTLDGVPVEREVQLHIAAPGRADSYITVIAHAAAPTDAGDVVLAPPQPPGVIRGVVRSIRGRGDGVLRARIHVEPTGQSTRADDNGEFEVQVAPGAYIVVIEAEGHASQRRRVTVEQLGVTVLNVDLRRER